MSRLERKHQKVFAGSATNNGVFGSLQAETKQYSNDVETLQSLPAYDDGWNAATISSEKLPPLEEFQSLGYIDSYQLAYLFQEGCPEYNSSATYYKGSIVKVIGDNGNYTIYGCKVDDTTGIDPTNTANWFKVYDTVSGVQSVSNMEQELSQNTTTYPSSKAVYDAFSTISPDLYEKVANKAQDLSSPNETTYPSTQAVANETSRIISIMYSIGSIYIGTQETCPLIQLIPGSSWELIGTSLISDFDITDVNVYGSTYNLAVATGVDEATTLYSANFRGDNIAGTGAGNKQGIGKETSKGGTYGVVNLAQINYRNWSKKQSGLTGDVEYTREALSVNIWKRTE